MIASGTTITPDLHQDWLAERQNSIGASECAAAIGASKYMTPIELWQLKTGRAKRDEANEAMQWGNLLEPVIIEEYERRTGHIVRYRQKFIRSKTCGYMTCTLDGATLTHDEDHLVEVKTASTWAKGWGDEETDDVPEQYMVQVHHQFACTGYNKADLVVLIGGQRLRIYRIERHQPMVDFIESKVAEFWEHVQADVPPDWGRMDAWALALLNPRCEGIFDLDEQAAGDVKAIEEATYAIKRYTKVKDDSKLRVLAAMGEHEFGRIPDGRLVKRYLEQQPERTQIVKAFTKHYFRVVKGDEE